MIGAPRKTLHSAGKWMSAALDCAVLCSGGTALAGDHLQTVLVLHSYHKADWTDSLMENVSRRLTPRRALPTLSVSRRGLQVGRGQE